MTFEVVPYDDRAEWLTARRSGLGASDIAGVLGISPWTTPFQVWASKVGEIPEDRDDESMRWGQILEGVILDEWEKVNNQTVTERGWLIRHRGRPYMMATVDGFTLTPDNRSAVAEAKNSSDWRWEGIPEHYYCQVQYQLAVSGFEVGYLIALHGGRRLETYEVPAVPDYQEMLTEAATDFWKLVEANEPPAVDAADNTIMSALWPRSTEKPIEIPVSMAVELYEARAVAKEATTQKAAIEAAVKREMGDADTAVVGQQVIATWRTGAKARSFLVKGSGLE